MSKASQKTREKIAKAISQAAEEPSSVSFDGVSVSNRSIKDLIEADKYIAQQGAATSPTLGIRMGRFIPQGH